MSEAIEVVGFDMMCFKIDPVTLEPLSCSYYEPAAWNDPTGPQMDIATWQAKRGEMWRVSLTGER